MSFASWVVSQAMKGLDIVEVVAERDLARCQKKIDALADRASVDKAFIEFTRDVRVSVAQYIIEIESIEEEKRELVAKAGTRLVESFPTRPRVKGFLTRSLISPIHIVTPHEQHQVTV